MPPIEATGSASGGLASSSPSRTRVNSEGDAGGVQGCEVGEAPGKETSGTMWRGAARRAQRRHNGERRWYRAGASTQGGAAEGGARRGPGGDRGGGTGG